MPDQDINNWPDQPEMVHHMPFLEEVAAKCSTIIEIGCGHGNGSTRAFERGLKRTTHPDGARRFLSVDDNVNKPDVKPTIEFWRKVSGDSRAQETRKEVRLALERVADLIYIDTDHIYEQMEVELALWSALADSDTLFLAHDVYMFGVYNHMTDAIIDFCKASPNWEYVELTKESHGMGMMRHRQGQWADPELVQSLKLYDGGWNG